MSDEFQQIVSLAHGLNKNELAQLVQLFNRISHERETQTDFEFSEADIAEIRERFRLIESGETQMSPWSEVRKRIVGEG